MIQQRRKQQNNILQISDLSLYGNVSLGISYPIFSAGGFVSTLLPTQVLSTHTGGFQDVQRFDFTKNWQQILQQYQLNDISFQGFYIGYTGNINFALLENIIKESVNEQTPFLFNPAFADNGKFYSGLNEEYLKGILPLFKYASIVVLNNSEWHLIKQFMALDDSDLMDYLAIKNLIISGIPQDNQIRTQLIKLDKTIHNFTVDKIDQHYFGTGDLFSSLLLLFNLEGLSIEKSIEMAQDLVRETILRQDKLRDFRLGLSLQYVLNVISGE